MIHSQDRSGYFGASDTRFVVGNYATDTFRRWWLEKLGIVQNHMHSKYLTAGTYYEGKILDALGFPIERDKQIILEDLLLRVNYDGTTDDEVYEVKTYRLEKGFCLSKAYREQVQVEMFAGGYRDGNIAAYGLEDDDYKNVFRPVDADRIEIYRIPYDEKFVEVIYLPRLRYLRDCLIRGIMPRMEDVS